MLRLWAAAANVQMKGSGEEEEEEEQLTLQLDSAERTVPFRINHMEINQPDAKTFKSFGPTCCDGSRVAAGLAGRCNGGDGSTCAWPQFNPLSATENPPIHS